jgi:hypothetical protein
MSTRVYLIVNGHGECRLTKRRPSLQWDEVAFPVEVQIPPGWGRVYDQSVVTLTLPPAPEIAPPQQVGAPETDSWSALQEQVQEANER